MAEIPQFLGDDRLVLSFRYSWRRGSVTVLVFSAISPVESYGTNQASAIIQSSIINFYLSGVNHAPEPLPGSTGLRRSAAAGRERPAAHACPSKVEAELAEAFAQRLQAGAEMRSLTFELFTPEVDTAFTSPGGETAVLWLALRDDAGRILATEPGLPLGRRAEAGWQMLLPHDHNNVRFQAGAGPPAAGLSWHSKVAAGSGLLKAKLTPPSIESGKDPAGRVRREAT